MKEEKNIFAKKVLNQAQIHILEMFNYCSTQQSVDELKDVLTKYYSQRVQQEADKLWDEGVLDEKAIDKLLEEHLRTPYQISE